MKNSKYLKSLLIWLLLFVICILLRLPHFLSKNFYFDDDEAIIGIMAQDFLSGQRIGYYFYGQNYGLSFFEMLSVAGWIKILGSSIWALRLGGLMLYSLGLTFLLKSAADRITSKYLLVVLALLLCTFPTWYLWGSLVRGGYVTAFASACMIFYFTQRETSSLWIAPILGVLSYITYDAHSFLVLPILPFLLMWWIKSPRKIYSAFVYSIVAVGLLLLAQQFLVFKGSTVRIPLEISNTSWENLMLHLSHWDHSFSGFYYFFAYLEPPFYWLVGIYAFGILFLGAILYLVFHGFKKNKLVVIATVLIALLGLYILSVISTASPRYMIGFFTIFLFFFVYLIGRVQKKWGIIFTTILTAISLLGVTVGSKISRHWIEGVNFTESLENTYNYAKHENIKAVFALDHQFTWNYLYGDEIPATSLCWKNRTMEFSNQVKTQFYSDSSKVMLFGMPNYSYNVNASASFSRDTIHVAKSIFVLRNVSQKDLENGRVVFPCYETEETRRIPKIK